MESAMHRLGADSTVSVVFLHIMLKVIFESVLCQY